MNNFSLLRKCLAIYFKKYIFLLIKENKRIIKRQKMINYMLKTSNHIVSILLEEKYIKILQNIQISRYKMVYFLSNHHLF